MCGRNIIGSGGDQPTRIVFDMRSISPVLDPEPFCLDLS